MLSDQHAAVEELKHKRELVNALIRRRRPLELQAAHRGLSAPPEILTEISSLTDQLREYEAEINHLETLAAQGALPLSEVEYRVLVAETWDTHRGAPSIIGANRLELSRLKLGILPERASEIEKDIRIALAQEAFGNIEPSFFTRICSSNAKSYTSDVNFEDSIVQLGRSIRLDRDTCRQLFIVNIVPESRSQMETQILRDLLLEYNKVHQHSEDFLLFNHFLIGLTADFDSYLRQRSQKASL